MTEWKYIERGLWKMYIDGVPTYEADIRQNGTFDLNWRSTGSFWKLIGNYPDFPTAKATAEKLEAERERERKLDEPGTFYVIHAPSCNPFKTLREATNYARNANIGLGVQDDEKPQAVVVTPVTI